MDYCCPWCKWRSCELLNFEMEMCHFVNWGCITVCFGFRWINWPAVQIICLYALWQTCGSNRNIIFLSLNVLPKMFQLFFSGAFLFSLSLHFLEFPLKFHWLKCYIFVSLIFYDVECYKHHFINLQQKYSWPFHDVLISQEGILFMPVDLFLTNVLCSTP